MNKNKKQKKEKLVEPGKKINSPNGGGNKVKKHIDNSKLIEKGVKKSGAWSCFGIINMCLFFILMGTVGACFYTASNGDLSIEGFQRAWPKLQKDMDHLINSTRTYIKAQELDKRAVEAIAMVTTLWNDYFPWSLYDSLKRNLRHGIAAVETYTGDLSPYGDFVTQKATGLFDLVADVCAIIIKQLQSFFSNLSLNSIIETCRFVFTFIVEQLYVLQEELYKNKAFVSVWEPCKKFLYEWVSILQKYIFEVCVQARDSWIPMLRNQTFQCFEYAKQSIVNLF